MRVERVGWHQLQDVLYAIRREVFVEEQLVPVEEEIDAVDPQCPHVLAYVDDKPVGTGRIHHGRIGRMAVLAAARGHGVGSAMLKELVDIASEAGCSEVVLDAQVQAIGFYVAHGFEVVGGIFMDAGIEHRKMVLSLRTSQR